MDNPWEGATYKDPHMARGLFNAKMSCALKKGTREIWWRYDTGNESWSAAPVLVGTVPDGAPLRCHCLLDGTTVIVTNGVITSGQSFLKRSTKYKNASFS